MNVYVGPVPYNLHNNKSTCRYNNPHKETGKTKKKGRDATADEDRSLKQKKKRLEKYENFLKTYDSLDEYDELLDYEPLYDKPSKPYNTYLNPTSMYQQTVHDDTINLTLDPKNKKIIAEILTKYITNDFHSTANNYSTYLNEIGQYLLNLNINLLNPNTNLLGYLIKTQIYCDFLQSEILFRGNRLLYFLYLEIQSELDMQYVIDRNALVIKDFYAGAIKNRMKGGDPGDTLERDANLLVKEVSHDFHGSGKALQDIDKIIELHGINIYMAKLINLSVASSDSNKINLTRFIDNLSSRQGEWVFMQCTLEYLLDIGKINECTFIKYRSVVSSNGAKTYFAIDIDGNPLTHNSLFDGGAFDCRFADNATSNQALSITIKSEITVDNANGIWKEPKIIIQNAPSLTDPATVGYISVANFYPRPIDILLFNFQKCQDLNNYFDPLNKHIVEIMCNGINEFFQLFGGRYNSKYDSWSRSFGNIENSQQYTTIYNTAPIKFIISVKSAGQYRVVTPDDTYFSYLQRLNNHVGAAENLAYYYSGIIIKYGDNDNDECALMVGDTTIKNIAALVNSDYISKQKNELRRQNNTNESWNRLIKLGSYIKSTIRDDRFQRQPEEDVLKFLIVSLKALGDWFQVYYTSSLHYARYTNEDLDVFRDIQIHEATGDKNTAAQSLNRAYSDSRPPDVPTFKMLGNGFSVKPSESLYKRFPAYFNNAAIPPNNYGEDWGTSIEQTSTEDQLPPKSNDNDDDNDSFGIGSLKGLITNVEIKDTDFGAKINAQVVALQTIYLSINENENEHEKESELYIFDSIIASESQKVNIRLILFFEFPFKSDVTQTSIPNDKYKDVYQALVRVQLSFQLASDTNKDLENDLIALIQLSELEQKSILKIIELKRDVTTAELGKLDSIYSNSNTIAFQTKLEDKIKRIINSPISGPLSSKITEFSSKINQKVTETKVRMRSFFDKIKEKASKIATTPTRQIRQVAFRSFGIVDFIKRHDPYLNRNNGGRRRARRTFKKYIKRTMKNYKGKGSVKKSGIKSFKKRIGVKYKNKMTRTNK
jgi:hypothetical protein